MSEEEIEIIERIEDTFLYSDLDRRISKLQKLTIYEDGIKDIKKLLELYQKEKEKNEELQELYTGKVQDWCKEKEKNKELENADLTTVYMNGFYDGEKKWKNKITEKIKELNDLESDFFQKLIEIARETGTLTEMTQNILQELLEERN